MCTWCWSHLMTRAGQDLYQWLRTCATCCIHTPNLILPSKQHYSQCSAHLHVLHITLVITKKRSHLDFFKVLLIIDSRVTDAATLVQVMVLLSVPQLKSTASVVRCADQHAVKDVKVPLSRVLANHTILLQQVWDVMCVKVEHSGTNTPLAYLEFLAEGILTEWFNMLRLMTHTSISHQLTPWGIK